MFRTVLSVAVLCASSVFSAPIILDDPSHVFSVAREGPLVMPWDIGTELDTVVTLETQFQVEESGTWEYTFYGDWFPWSSNFAILGPGWWLSGLDEVAFGLEWEYVPHPIVLEAGVVYDLAVNATNFASLLLAKASDAQPAIGSPVPEPCTFALLALGGSLVVAMRRKR